jgi:hypothetical protein
MRILRAIISLQQSIALSPKALPQQLPTALRFKAPSNRYFYAYSTMAQHGHSAACCSIPPIVSKGYDPKGKYETIGGTKTCKLLPPQRFTWICILADSRSSDVSGPANASRGLLFVFDIFGYFPQSLQGADILATSDKDHAYQVFMPDFFDGKPADISWYRSPSPSTYIRAGKSDHIWI